MKVLLVDDHQILRDGIRRGLESAGKDVVGEAGNGEEAIGLVGETDPDIVVMDLSMPVLDGVGATRQISELYPDVKVVVLTMHDDPAKTRAALEAGAVAYLTKGTSLDEVIDTLDRVMDGEEVLSPHLAASMLQVVGGLKPTEESLLSDRQVEILQMIANGLSTKQVARELGITQKTVHNHLNAIYRRLDTQSLTHAVLSAVRLGIIDLNPEGGDDELLPVPLRRYRVLNGPEPRSVPLPIGRVRSRPHHETRCKERSGDACDLFAHRVGSWPHGCCSRSLRRPGSLQRSPGPWPTSPARRRSGPSSVSSSVRSRPSRPSRRPTPTCWARPRFHCPVRPAPSHLRPPWCPGRRPSPAAA
jgi:DNA-binding NarL/FixJ family response regulator